MHGANMKILYYILLFLTVVIHSFNFYTAKKLRSYFRGLGVQHSNDKMLGINEERFYRNLSLKDTSYIIMHYFLMADFLAVSVDTDCM